MSHCTGLDVVGLLPAVLHSMPYAILSRYASPFTFMPSLLCYYVTLSRPFLRTKHACKSLPVEDSHRIASVLFLLNPHSFGFPGNPSCIVSSWKTQNIHYQSYSGHRLNSNFHSEVSDTISTLSMDYLNATHQSKNYSKYNTKTYRQGEFRTQVANDNRVRDTYGRSFTS